MNQLLTRMSVYISLLLALCLSSASAIAAGSSGSVARTMRFGAADVFRLRTIGDIAISPDGRTIAYVRRDADIMTDSRRSSLRLIDAATGAERLVADDASEPSFSPDGRSLAWLASAADSLSRLTIAEANGARPHPVGASADGFDTLAWSPRGDAIAFTRFVPIGEPRYVSPVEKPAGAHWSAPPRIYSSIRTGRDGERDFVPGCTQLFVIERRDGKVRQLTHLQTDVSGRPAWSPDGGSLLFSAQQGDELDRSYLTARLYRVSAEGGAPVAMSPVGLGARDMTIAPDGRSIAFIAAATSRRDYEPSGLYLMNADGSGLRRLDTGLDREIGDPRFAADGRAVYASYGDHGETRLARFAVTGGREVVVDALDGSYALAEDGTLAYARPSPNGPPDLVLRRPEGRDRKLTDLNGVLLRQRALATKHSLKVRSSLDGSPVGAWITLPPGHLKGRRHPLILSIHGGPYGADDPWWDVQDQLLAAAGYAVLHANYRGSISYGFAFADRIAHDFPGPSYADLMSAVDAAIAAGLADPERLYVTGGSAGGMLTAWIVGSTDRFKAAAALKPVIDPVSHALTTDQVTASNATFGGQPWEVPQAYQAQNILALVGRMQTPTMLMVGALDRRTPPTEAQQLYAALKLRRVPTELAIMPDAGHDSLEATPSRLIATTALMLDWFGRYGGQPAPAAIKDD